MQAADYRNGLDTNTDNMSSKPPSNPGPRANLLVVGSNWINALLPSTLITQADALIQGHRLDDALTLADQQLKKFQGRSVDQDEVRPPFPSAQSPC